MFAGKDQNLKCKLKRGLYRVLTTLQRSGTVETSAKYSHSFNYPTITLTSINEDKEVITGTIVSYAFKADDITFKNSKNETVWMQMTRKK
jgi:hypothetical protein